MIHQPVLKKEILKCLDPKPNENFVDCTINGAGHSLALLERIKPEGKVLGIDLDREVLEKIGSKDNLILVCANFADLKKIVKKAEFSPVNGILLDLGMSSWHLEKSGKGFSFLRNEPLDMRYSFENDLTAEKIVNHYSQKELERILKEYGQERFAKRIAKKIIEKRPIKSTLELVEVIKRAGVGKARIHPATRTFQALRIAVNEELDNLIKVLSQAVEILAPRGRLAVISFHSLEDRIVKTFFRNLSFQEFKILSKKPIRPSLKEIQTNPRSRSAKLRAIVKYGQ